MVIKIPASEASKKVNRYTKSSSTHSLGCTVQPRLLRLSPLALVVVTQCTSGEGTNHSLLCSLQSLKSILWILEFKMISFIFFNLLTKTFLQIFSFIFLTISGRVAGWAVPGYVSVVCKCTPISEELSTLS
jgi:hypothetical protein